MKSFAILSLAAAAAAMPAPDHVITVLATCTDAPGAGATETVTITVGAGSNGGNGGNGGYPQAPVTVTVTETETVTSGSAGITYPAGGNGGNGGNGGSQYTYTSNGVTYTTSSGDSTTYTSAGQTYTTELPPSNTETGAPTVPTTYTVAVGAFPIPSSTGKAFEFRPNNVKANIGDTIRFQMLSLEHSVTQSSFAKPCVHSGDFDTQLQMNKNNRTDLFEDFPVTAESPTWFYCKQTKMVDHCGKGMVFGLNPKSPQQMLDFIGNAKAQNGTTIPTQPTGAPIPVTVGGSIARQMMW